MLKKSIEVPCNSCQACCKGMHIVLQPDKGDDPNTFETHEIINPLTKEKQIALKHKEGSSDCIYLNEKGCSIHDRIPLVCKEFDCRKFWKRLLETTTRPQRKRIVKGGVINRKILLKGRLLFHTLPKDYK